MFLFLRFGGILKCRYNRQERWMPSFNSHVSLWECIQAFLLERKLIVNASVYKPDVSMSFLVKSCQLWLRDSGPRHQASTNMNTNTIAIHKNIPLYIKLMRSNFTLFFILSLIWLWMISALHINPRCVIWHFQMQFISGEHLSNTLFIQSEIDAVMIRKQFRSCWTTWRDFSENNQTFVIDHFNASGSVAVLAVSNKFNNGKVEAQREIKWNTALVWEYIRGSNKNEVIFGFETGACIFMRISDYEYCI